MKKITTILLILIMCISFAACGGNDTVQPSGIGGNGGDDPGDPAVIPSGDELYTMTASKVGLIFDMPELMYEDTGDYYADWNSVWTSENIQVDIIEWYEHELTEDGYSFTLDGFRGWFESWGSTFTLNRYGNYELHDDAEPGYDIYRILTEVNGRLYDIQIMITSDKLSEYGSVWDACINSFRAAESSDTPQDTDKPGTETWYTYNDSRLGITMSFPYELWDESEEWDCEEYESFWSNNDMILYICEWYPEDFEEFDLDFTLENFVKLENDGNDLEFAFDPYYNMYTAENVDEEYGDYTYIALFQRGQTMYYYTVQVYTEGYDYGTFINQMNVAA